jgi:hypothetical protein
VMSLFSAPTPKTPSLTQLDLRPDYQERLVNDIKKWLDQAEAELARVKKDPNCVQRRHP